MTGFNFEKNLDHQSKAVAATVAVFDGFKITKPIEALKQFANPRLDLTGSPYASNIRKIREEYGVEGGKIKNGSSIIDIMMETGTGKTYTYTKTIFEINKRYGIFKFVIIVPTLSIKAGTIDFLKSESSRNHFKEQYDKSIALHIVESQKGGKTKKSFFPPSVNNFVKSESFDKKHIQVMLINAGMINSDTMQKNFDVDLFDQYSVPFDAIAATNPFVIIDEPHKFTQGNKTWTNIQKIKPQFIIRYGATFPEFENLIYTLTAVDAFNKNLVKGVIGHITEFPDGKNAIVKFIDSDGTEARFELTENDQQNTVSLSKKESFEKIHKEMHQLYLENLSKSRVVLSNGLELKKGDKINPYTYAETIQEIMIDRAIRKHFEIEKSFLKREVRIKPLTLFFIDNIEEYRNQDGYIRKAVEERIKSAVESLLKTEDDVFYRKYLENTLKDISKTHGGYFSKDNTEKDEVIEQEVIEILHDKQAILSLDNPRRFIFSKWTLREGWDNPNVFQICKLRSSGSEISKLQEVGRGLRLPVNEFGNRVKDEQFYLNYFVDFTESDFIIQLVNEINEKSGAISMEDVPVEIDDKMIKQILEKYHDQFTSKEQILSTLDDANIINRSNEFKHGGFDYIKSHFPLIFKGLRSNKVRTAEAEKNKINIRAERYLELQDLWEKLNQRVILEYKVEYEAKFQDIFSGFLQDTINSLTEEGITFRQQIVVIEDDAAGVREENTLGENEIPKISTMSYDEFLMQASQELNVNIKTLHKAFGNLKVDINNYRNIKTIRILKEKFDWFLLTNAIDVFGIEYQKVTNTLHPTKLTDSKGNVLSKINSSDIGVIYSEEEVADNYFFDELYFDSELEKQNIKTNITDVIVFTKIPKNSIKIPVAGGRSYSPDFAYVINYDNGMKKLYFIVETKNAYPEALRDEEKQKIRHAEKFFGKAIEIKFKTQFSNKKITELIREIYN